VDEEAAPAQAENPVPRRANRGPWRVVALTAIGVVLALYLASLVGYHVLGDKPRDFAFTESTPATETAVIVRLRQLDTAQNSLSVDILVHPGRDLLDKNPRSANQFVVRLSSWTASGELIHVHADVANDTTTTLITTGDPDDWPFDSYTTDVIGVETFSGSGAQLQPVPAEVIVAGHINGWDISSGTGTISSPAAPPQTVRFTLERSQAALAFDISLILVLLALPATALFVAIQTLMGHRKFLPPFTTWFAAMLFAVVPLRNLLPGAPPAGAWIDQALVGWVLLALAAAMVMYVAAWWRSRNSD
jgi:hypothetical protein